MLESSAIVLELAFDLSGNQTSAVLRELPDTGQPLPAAAAATAATIAAAAAATAAAHLPPQTQTCRVCLLRRRLVPGGNGNGHHQVRMRGLFEPFELGARQPAPDGGTLADLMEMCASIPAIDADHTTPQHICASCEQQLRTAVAFKVRCERSDQEFRTHAYRAEHLDCIKRESTEWLDQSNAHVDLTGAAEPADTYSIRHCAGATPAVKAEVVSPGAADRSGCSSTGQDENVQPVAANGRPQRAAKRKRPSAVAKKAPVAAVNPGDKEKVPRRGKSVRRRLKCPECDSTFVQKSSLNVHMRLHTGEKPYVCDICDERFRTHSAIADHIARHTDRRDHGCSLCPFRTRTRSNLRAHLSTRHCDDRRHECPDCQQRFKTSSNMRKHQRSVHRQLRAHSCPECERAFSTAEALRKHAVRHTGRRPFACPICWRAYGWYSGLQKHAEAKHEGVRMPTEMWFRRKAEEAEAMEGAPAKAAMEVVCDGDDVVEETSVGDWVRLAVDREKEEVVAAAGSGCGDLLMLGCRPLE